MSSISIHNWKQTDIDGTDIESDSGTDSPQLSQVIQFAVA